MMFVLTFWANRHWPDKHGYTPGDEESTARFRIGPLVIGWELHREMES